MTPAEERDIIARQIAARDPRWGEFFAATAIGLLTLAIVSGWMHL